MQPGSSVDAQSLALSACIYHSLIGHLPEYDRGIKRARFAVLRLTNVPAVLIEGGFLTERGESKLISNKDWRAKLAGAIGIGIESYQALPVKKQPPMIVADYRRQAKSAPVDPAVQESDAKDADGNVKEAEGNVKQAARNVKEADASLLQLVGRSALLSQPQTSTPVKRSSLESAPIIP
jgi:hypothetical protein